MTEMTKRIDLTSQEPLPPIDVPVFKRRIGIEALLRWAYVDELPKAHELASFTPAGFGGAWGGTERYGELMTIIDAPENEFGLAPDLTATTMPHHDAIRVHNAVCGLDALELTVPDGWNPLADLSAFDGLDQAIARAIAQETRLDEYGRRFLKTTPGRLIRKHALMGGCPEWEVEPPQRHMVCSSRGKPRWFRRTLVTTDEGDFAKGIQPTYLEVEVDGLDPKLRIPYPDSYQKTYFDPDPVEAVVARAEYEVWRVALDVLAIDLEVGLDAHVVTPSIRPQRPWETGESHVRTVLPDMTRASYTLTLANGYWGSRIEA